MSSFIASKVRIRIFDFHLSLPGVLGSAQVKPELSFLLDPDGYDPGQASPATGETGHFLLRPLRAGELALGRKFTPNKFWAQYFDQYSFLPADTRRRWRRQIPLRGIPKDFQPMLVADEPKVKAQVRAKVWLWPFGWASNLSMVLNQELSLTGLRALVRAVDQNPVFRLEDKALNLTGLFSELGNRVRLDMYGQTNIGQLQPAIPRYTVVSIEDRTSYPALQPGWNSRYFAFFDGDRALLHGALLGEEIDAAAVIKREQENKFTRTEFINAGFGITYFHDQGGRTLLDVSVARPLGRDGGCLAGNASLCAMVALGLASFVGRAGQPEYVGAAALTELAAVAKAALLSLPERYPNPFCRDLFANHSRLKALRQ